MDLNIIVIVIVLLFFINLFRQISYLLASKFRNVFEFIDSYESRYLHYRRIFWLEVLKELFLSIVLAFLAFKFNLYFLIFGISIDALIDVFIALNFNFYSLLIKNLHVRFFIREILIPYLFFGILFQVLKVNVIMFLVVIFLLQIIIFSFSNRIILH